MIFDWMSESTPSPADRYRLEKEFLQALLAAERIYKNAAAAHARAMQEAAATNWKLSPDQMGLLYEAVQLEQSALRDYTCALKVYGELVLYGRLPAEESKTAMLLTPLTPRETEVLRLIVSGLSNKRIAAHLNISFKTVVAHRTRLMQKLNVHDVATLVRYAIRHHLAEP